jgi:hypothetical protein
LPFSLSISNIVHFARLGKPLPAVPPNRLRPQISTEKSAQRGQINTADFSVWFPGQKIVECKKVPRMRAIAAFFEAGHAGSREMVFDLLVDAKPSPSW